MTLNIRINDDWRITSDNFNVILNERYFVDPTKSPKWKEREKAGASPDPREEWREVGYYATVESALDAIVDKAVIASDAESLGDLRKEIRQIRRDISAVLDG